MVNRRNKNTFMVALTGICLAFSVIGVFLASFVPGVELTLYALSSFFVGVVLIETGLKGGVLLYIAATLLIFVIVPNKLAVIPYALFFGIYGIIKYIAEKPENKIVQYAIKLIFYFVVAGISIFAIKGLFFGDMGIPTLGNWALFIGGTFVFVLYDFIYTLGMGFYRDRIKKHISKDQREDFKLS
ncbi:MAG: hypothetical protein RR495_04715 [Anaerovoracaceae bacterium]